MHEMVRAVDTAEERAVPGRDAAQLARLTSLSASERAILAQAYAGMSASVARLVERLLDTWDCLTTDERIASLMLLAGELSGREAAADFGEGKP